MYLPRKLRLRDSFLCAFCFDVDFDIVFEHIYPLNRALTNRTIFYTIQTAAFSTEKNAPPKSAKRPIIRMIFSHAFTVLLSTNSIRIAILIQCFCAFAPRGAGGVQKFCCGVQARQGGVQNSGRGVQTDFYGVQMNVASPQTGSYGNSKLIP